MPEPGAQPAPDPGGELVLTPPGAVVVATDEVLGMLDGVRRIAERLRADHARLSEAARTLAWSAASVADYRVHRCTLELDGALHATRTALELAERLDRTTRLAMGAYAALERVEQWRASATAAVIAGFAGHLFAPLLAHGLPVVGGLALALWAAPDGDERLRAVQRWIRENPRLITSPEFVETVRLIASSTDDAAEGAFGVPPGITLLLGDEGLGLLGVTTSSAAIVGATSLVGVFRETPVRVERTSTARLDRPAAGALERYERIPEGDDQVRIERYEAPGRPDRYVVYVGGTQDFAPVPAGEPWDMTSNMAGVAGLPAGSIRATELAMSDAGIGPGDEVQFVGYSQGGLVAARLAADGDWNAAGLATFGAPTGAVELPEGLAGMAVRNTDDVVPALGGLQTDDHLLQVERRAFPPGADIPADDVVPAHRRPAYEATARAIDAADSEALRQQTRLLDRFTADYAARPGARMTVLTYHGERVAEPAAVLR